MKRNLRVRSTAAQAASNKLTPIAAAVGMMILGASFAAQAQQAAEQPTDPSAVVTVTGVRAALAQSLAQKRNAESHVEVITAEDIGKMPDKNVADSLQRVPGVTISSAGATEGGFDENDRVSMRGTNPSFTQTLVNGHNIGSGDWFVLNQTGTVGRSVSYTLLPSEIVGSVVVHKSSEAKLVEGGIAGSIDIISRKPLDFKKDLTIEASVGAVYAQLPGKTDPQFSGLINWKNPEKTFGVLVQGFSETRHVRRDGVEVLGYDQIMPGSKIALSNPDLSGVYVPHDIGSALFEQERKRTGGLIDLQFKPNSDLSMDVSAFKSDMKAANYNRNYLLWTPHFIDGGNGQAPAPGYVVKNNTLVSATFAPVAGTQYGIYDQISRPDESASTGYYAFEGKWRATSDLTFTTNFGTSEGHGKTPTQDVAEWDTNVGSGASYTLNGVNSAPSFNFGNSTTGKSAVAGLDWIFGDQNYDVVDKEKWFQLDAKYALDAGALRSVEFGVRGNEHQRGLTGVINQRPALDGSAFAPGAAPTTYSTYPSNFGSGLGSGFPTNVWFYTADQLSAFAAKYAYRPTDGSRENFASEFEMKETNYAGYVQGNLQGDGWSGNAGLRLVHTKEHVINYTGVSAETPGAILTSLFGPFMKVATDHTYNDVLPSANLRFDVSKDIVGRLAASRTMTRADYSALAGGLSLSPPAVDGGRGTGSGGNPDLKPIVSNNLDATLEYYFAPKSLFSAGVFYMDLTSMVGLGRVTKVNRDFSNAHPNGVDVTYDLTVPVNTSGSVKGAELALDLPFLNNYGISTNYTYADGKESGGNPLVGASRNTANFSAYFENEKFNARVSYNYRSSFYSGLDRSTAFYQAGGGVASATLGYKVSENIALTLDMLNLNNPTLKYYALNESQPRSIYQSGRQFYLNAHIKF
ncbi:MAG: chiP-II [Massilia sp.]|nr:chiP-II [Massilia sp.]